ncbi:hypothetical protein AB0J86_34645 [Micromonospora sp. NPDC049559]|uniref:hypothetical protein n=1 Tax=Micromonospora sp. NPDC049559 TaxID=3155923 RepID=UPI003445FD94
MTEYPPIHAPSRPDWSCTACADAWPCNTRKLQLRDLFQDNTAGLVNYLAQYLTDANLELGHLSSVEVSERFVDWCAPGAGRATA